MALPVVDFSLIASGTYSQRILTAKELVNSLKTHGFVKLRSHGLPSDTIDALFSWVGGIHLKTSAPAQES